MARRNLFQPPPPPSEAPAPESRFPATGAMSGVRSTLKDLSNNAVRELETELIDDGGPSDRLAFGEADVAELAESIRAHGQQVPIMVRTLPSQPGRFQIVYGRRRLMALRVLGQRAKALVRTLDDEEALFAQSHENNQRLDPSFIEKALFLRELTNAGYADEAIRDALAVDAPMFSRMKSIAGTIPVDVIHEIGPAHGIGRRRWEALAKRAAAQSVDLSAFAKTLHLKDIPGSVERFERLAAAVDGLVAAPKPESRLVVVDGHRLGELRPTARALTLKMVRADNPGFTEWLEDNAEDALRGLYEAWQSHRD